MIDEQRVIEERLAKATMDVIASELKLLPSSTLIILLGSKSGEIAESAAMRLAEKKDAPLVIDALLNNRFRTKRGRMLATWVLNVLGCLFPNSVDAYLHCLNDRSDDVVSNALFGIVFMRRRDLIPRLRQHLSAAQPGSERFKELEEAIAALEANNPSQFSPGFLDSANVWRLNETS